MAQNPNHDNRRKRKKEESTELTPLFSHKRVFQGFAPPTSNTTYTPNQFFDVCLPYSSRGCLRLVAYMIRRTLGWCDADGNPQEEQIVISYADLVENAGISRGGIATAIDEALRGNFIACLRKGHPKSAGRNAISALYELTWDDGDQYIKSPGLFRGFFEGEGNRTDIPNQFFDEIIPSESLAVIKVVGSIVRFSIGFQAKRGRRRQQATMSYNDLQRYAKISVRRHLARGVREALEANYIIRIQKGVFTPDISQQMSTIYALKWLDSSSLPNIGSKKTPGELETHITQIGSIKTPAHRSKEDTSNGPKKTPGDRFKKDTTLQTKHINETLKQQRGQHAVANRELVSLLKAQGLSEKDSAKLATTYPEKLIRQQVEWLAARNPRNPAGMLRKAIEEEWSAPIKAKCLSSDNVQGQVFAAAYYAGFAGNDDAPTAQPSSKEIELSTSYLDQLLKMWPEATLVEAHGRRFGAFVRERKPITKDFRTTFTLALRLFGDEFYKDLQQYRVAEVKRRADEQREIHKRDFLNAYKRFLEDEEDRIKRAQKTRYSEFLEERAKRRATIETGRFIRSSADRKRMLAEHDNDRARLTNFLEFFCDEVADFWTWDREQNPDAFGKVASL